VRGWEIDDGSLEEFPSMAMSFSSFLEVSWPRPWWECSAYLAVLRAQHFIYFGLLQEFVGPSTQIDDFTRISEITSWSVITLSKLHAILEKRGRIEEYPDSGVDDIFVAAAIQARHVRSILCF